MATEVRTVKYDKAKEAAVAASFQSIGDAYISLLAASQQHDWDVRQRASESLGKAAAEVYRALTQDGESPAG